MGGSSGASGDFGRAEFGTASNTSEGRVVVENAVCESGKDSSTPASACAVRVDEGESGIGKSGISSSDS